MSGSDFLHFASKRDFRCEIAARDASDRRAAASVRLVQTAGCETRGVVRSLRLQQPVAEVSLHTEMTRAQMIERLPAIGSYRSGSEVTLWMIQRWKKSSDHFL